MNVNNVAVTLLLGLLAARPHLAGTAYHFSQGLLLVPALVAAGLVLLSRPVAEAAPKSTDRSLFIPWMLAAWAFLSLLWCPDPGQGLRDCAALLLNLIVFSLVYQLTAADPGLRRASSALLSLLAVPVVLHALYQRFFGLARLRRLLGEMAAGGENVSDLMNVISEGRVYAGFLNSNMLAGFLAILVPYTLDLALAEKTGPRRVLLSLLLACQAWVLVLSGSLGGTAAAAAMAVAVVLVRRGARRRELAAVAALAALVLLFLIAGRGMGFLGGQQSSLTQRLSYAAAGARMAAVHPLLGWGAGSSPGALMGFVAEGVRPVTDPHNFLIRSWIDWGIAGPAALLWFFGSALFHGLRSGAARGFRTLPEGAIGLAFGGGAFVLHGLVDMDFSVPEVAMFGWAALGAALGSLAAPRGDGTGQGRGSGPALRFAAGALVFALVLPTLLFLQGELIAFRAERALREKKPALAARLYSEALAFIPFNGRFAMEEGRARLAAGDGEAARDLFRKAGALMTASPYPAWELGRAAQAAGQWAESVPHLTMAMDRYPTSPRIRLDLARSLFALGDRAGARRLLEEARRQAVFDPEARAFAEKSLEVLAP